MKKIGYRVYKAYTDNYGNITHKTLIGFAKTLQAARALRVNDGGLTVTLVEKAYSTQNSRAERLNPVGRKTK